MQIALLHALADGGALHLIPSTKAFTEPMRTLLTATPLSIKTTETLVDLCIGGQLRKALATECLVSELLQAGIKGLMQQSLHDRNQGMLSALLPFQPLSIGYFLKKSLSSVNRRGAFLWNRS